MRKNWILGFSACVILLLVACTPPEEEALPTLIPTGVPPTAIPVGPTTPPDETATPTPNYTPTLVFNQELPPTWTPTFTITPTPTVIPTEEPTIEVRELPATCDTFEPLFDQSARTFPAGASPHVAWVPAEGTRYYRVWVQDEFGNELFVDYIAETSIDFPADIFEAGHRYGWSVFPVDQFGIQMCYTRGSELNPVAGP